MVACNGRLPELLPDAQFMFGVGGYIIARVLAILLPLFFVNQPGQEDLAIRIVLILENFVLWGFLATLAYIFRYWQFHSAGSMIVLLRIMC